MTVVLSNPLDSGDAQRLGLDARVYAVGETVVVEDWAGLALVRVGYARTLAPGGPVGLIIGEGEPYPGLGAEGQWYLDEVGQVLYGPKSSGVWPEGSIQPGRGIASAEIVTGHLILHYTDGADVDVGNVAGPPGSGSSTTSTGITDSTVIGRQLITAADQAAVQAIVGSSGDHGNLTGLADDDHLQYHTDARGDARYVRTFADPNADRIVFWDDSASAWAALSPTAPVTITGTALSIAAATAAATGIVELADNTETQTGTDTTRAVTPAGLAARTSTETRTGVVELATAAESTTGTDNTRAVHPAGLKAVTDAIGVSAPTVSTLVRRDVAGRFQAVDPSATADVATKLYVDTGDTAAKARANHTGTQLSSTLSDLTETVQDIVAAFVVAGTGVVKTYDDTANTLTLDSTGGGGGSTDPEIVRDVIGGAIVAGAGITSTVNDAGDTITIASTAVLPTRQVISGTGLAGGGDLSADRTLTVVYGSTAATAVQGNDARVVADQVAGTASIRTLGTGAQQAAAGNDTRIVGAVQTSRTITAGTGLTGGGDLTANRTLAVAYGTTASTAVQGNDTRVVADQAAATASIRTIGTGALQAKAGNYTPPIADLPAGSVLYALKAAGVWPSRPTARTDVMVIWKGPDPAPTIGGVGMVDGVDENHVTP